MTTDGRAQAYPPRMVENKDVLMWKRIANTVLVVLTPYTLFFFPFFRDLDDTVLRVLIWSTWVIGLTWIWVAHPLLNRRRSHE